MTRASYERGNEARGQITNVASDESLHPHETGKHLSSPVMQLAQWQLAGHPILSLAADARIGRPGQPPARVGPSCARGRIRASRFPPTAARAGSGTQNAI